MGLDSVDIVMNWEKTFGMTLSDAEVVPLLTPRMAIDLICAKLGAVDGPGFCPTQRAFHRYRAGIRAVTGEARQKVRLSDRIRDLRPGGKIRENWQAFGLATGFADCRAPWLLFGGRVTVRTAVEGLAFDNLSQLFKPGERWTRSLVRFGVREGVSDVAGTRDFRDDDHFIHDIKID